MTNRLWLLLLLCFLAPCAHAAGGACPTGANYGATNFSQTLSSLGISSCYFVAASGSDSNNGTSESTPWLHAPGMPNCVGNCASALGPTGEIIAGGIGIIFRGGDTWHFGNASPASGVATGGEWIGGSDWWGTDANCQYEGTASGCIYAGVDLTWYSGASWVRPVFTADNPASTSLVSACAYQVGSNNNMMQMGVAWWLDDIEITGFCSSRVPASSGPSTDIMIGYGGTGDSGSGMLLETRLYIHGWTATTAAGGASNSGLPCDMLGGGNNGLQSIVQVVVDGSDSNPGACAWAVFPSFYHFKDSIVRYTTQGVGQWCHDIHDNIFEYMSIPNMPTHGNVLECNSDASGSAVNQPQNTPNVVYNNIIRHDNPNWNGSGDPHFWFCPTQIPEYWFNNLVYDAWPNGGNGWAYAGPSSYGCSNTGGQYMFNNTLVDFVQVCNPSTVTNGGKYLTVYNEHLINTPFDDDGPTPCTGISSATNIAMTDATATSQGYTTGSSGTAGTGNTCANEGTTPCSPTSNSNSTVGAGTNFQSYCTTLAGYSAEYAISTEAANACKYSTTDGCEYVVSGHYMSCPNQSPVSRPASPTAWDVGAYQYSGSSPPPTLATPTCTPGAGNYASSQSVTCSVPAGATGCYTVNGTTPTGTSGSCTNGSTYSGAITVSVNETLEIMATESGYTNSGVNSYAYQIGPIFLLQRTQSDSCAAGSTCTVTITATTTGTALVAFANNLNGASQNHLSSVTDSGGTPDTFAGCVTLGGSSCNNQGATVGNADIQIALSGNGGNTSLTCNLASSNTHTWTCGVYEFQSLNSPATFSLAASGSAGDTSSATTQPGVTLSGLSGNNAIVQLIDPNITVASISPAGNGGNAGYLLNVDGFGNAEAALWNTATGTAPTYTLASSGVGGVAAAALVTPAASSQAPAPTFSPSSPYAGSATSLTASDALGGATLCYAPSTPPPGPSSPGTCPAGATTYSGAISVSTSGTYYFYATKSGYTTSATVSWVGTIESQAVAPTITPTTPYTGGATNITLSTSTPGASIYYAWGSTPTCSSTLYSGSFAAITGTLETIACAAGYTNSTVTTGSFTIETQLATPTFSPLGGTYPSSQSVTITIAAGATGYYTTNGSAPTCSSTQYTAPVTVSSSLTLKAIACEAGYLNSNVGQASYTISSGGTPVVAFSIYQNGSWVQSGALNFGSLWVYNPSTSTSIRPSSAQGLLVTNVGTATLTWTAVSITSSGATFSNTSPSGGSFCGTTGSLAQGASCYFTLGVALENTGSYSGLLSLTDNTSNGTDSISLSVTGYNGN